MSCFPARSFVHALGLLAAASAIAPAAAQPSGQALYQRNCASCHGAERQGTGLGPALSPATYRYGGTRSDLARMIRNGMAAQGMPAFGGLLSAEEIEAVAAFLPARERPAQSAAEQAAEAEAPPRTFDAVPGEVQALDYRIRAELFADGLQTVWAMAFIDADTAPILSCTRRTRSPMARRTAASAAGLPPRMRTMTS